MTLDSATATAIVLVLGGFASAVTVIVKAVTSAKLQIMAAGRERQIVNTEKLDAIEAKVNGNAMASAAKIDSLHEQVADAKSMIADLHQTAAVLAAGHDLIGEQR